MTAMMQMLLAEGAAGGGGVTFGASPFLGTVPSGYTAGWPV